MKAGKPEVENDYDQVEVDGIPLYIRKDLAKQQFEINWVGFWIFGQFLVKER